MRIPRGGGRRLGWIGLALALASCRPSPEAVADGEDPLAALASPVQSALYDGPYWTREARRNSPSWRAAKAFCRKSRDSELPNCHAVRLVERWEGPLRSPGIGAPATMPTMPALPPPPPRPPALHPGDPDQAAADVAAVKAWEARLLARGQGAAAGGLR
jgi:hypothetical protein